MKINFQTFNPSLFVNIPFKVSSYIFSGVSKVSKIFYLYLVVYSQAKAINFQNSKVNSLTLQDDSSMSFETLKHFVTPGFVSSERKDSGCSFIDAKPITPSYCQLITDREKALYPKQALDSMYSSENELPDFYKQGCVQETKGSYPITPKQIQLCLDPNDSKILGLTIQYLRDTFLYNLDTFKDENKILEKILVTNQFLSNSLPYPDKNGFVYFQKNSLTQNLRNNVLLKKRYRYYKKEDWKRLAQEKKLSKEDKRLLLKTIKNLERKKKSNDLKISNQSIALLQNLNLILPLHGELKNIFSDLCLTIKDEMQKILENNESPINLAAFVYFKIWQCQFFEKQNKALSFLLMNTILVAGKEKPVIFPDYSELENIIEKSNTSFTYTIVAFSKYLSGIIKKQSKDNFFDF